MPANAPTCVTRDVAGIIPERVLDPGGDFTVSTNPTVSQVQGVIAAILQEVEAVVGFTVDDRLAEYATLTVATGAAAQVELAFTSDVAEDAQSKYKQLWEQYQYRLKQLGVAVQTIIKGDTPGETEPRFSQFVLPNVTDPLQPPYPYTQAREQF